MLLGRARFGIGGSWAFEPYVLGGLVRFEERVGDGAPGTDSFDGFQGKFGVPFRYAFSDSASLRFDVSFQHAACSLVELPGKEPPESLE